MKSLLYAISTTLAVLMLSLMPIEAEAKRLGGGKPAGMQRQAPAKPADAPTASPGANAAAPAAAGGAAAAAGKRSWMGPIAGLAAGLGLAALFSHLGMGEEFGNIVMMVLLALAAFMLIRFVMRRFAGGAQQAPGGMRLAGAGASPDASLRTDTATARSSLATGPAALAGGAGPTVAGLPDGMPAAEFERVAKMVFIRLQAANDEGNTEDLRRFTTPELFSSLKADLLERGGAAQKTDVVHLEAKIIDTAEEAGQHIVTVRFQGLIREAADAGAEPFDELWHLVRPTDGRSDWAIAGIAPMQ